MDSGLALLTSAGELLHPNPAFLRLLSCTVEPRNTRELTQSMVMTAKTTLQWDEFLQVLYDQSVTVQLLNGKSLQWRKKRVQHPQHGPCWALMMTDVTNLHVQIAQLTAESERDVLTGIANRRKFDLEFSRAIELTRRTGQKGALLLFDLDNFKSINDRYGHRRGDWVLEQVGPAVGPLIRRYELLARVGGDEFGILISHAGERAVNRLCAQLPKALESINGSPYGAAEPIRASIGSTLFPQSDLTTRDLYDIADRALYQDKNQKLGAAQGGAVLKTAAFNPSAAPGLTPHPSV
jgi:diguanylate cyclase (GGDEF)-like protein